MEPSANRAPSLSPNNTGTDEETFQATRVSAFFEKTQCGVLLLMACGMVSIQTSNYRLDSMQVSTYSPDLDDLLADPNRDCTWAFWQPLPPPYNHWVAATLLLWVPSVASWHRLLPGDIYARGARWNILGVRWVIVLRWVYVAWSIVYGGRFDGLGGEVYERNRRISGGAGAASIHLLKMCVFNSISILTTAIMRSATLIPWKPQLLSTLVCVACSWVVHEEIMGAASWDPELSEVSTGLHLFATMLALGEVLLGTLSEWREKSLFVSRVEHDQGQRAFLASVAHELRTPLHGVLGMLSSLIDWQSGAQQLPAKAEGWLRVANECSGNLLHLVNDVLDLTKSEIGVLDVQVKTRMNQYTLIH